MRRIFIIAALATAVFLHVRMWKKAPATRSPIGHAQTADEISGPVSALADISASMQGERITVTGKLSAVWEPIGKRAPHTLILRDGSGALEIVHWLKYPLPVDVGDWVQCTGTIDLYRGALQLRLWNSSELQIFNP